MGVIQTEQKWPETQRQSCDRCSVQLKTSLSFISWETDGQF
uniref:Uncharacterized protein n=1 Tax=Anguilla anguilla TaxID=7936 RepID=A0A0E9TLW4_ANGAN